jgi:hypothetical protein
MQPRCQTFPRRSTRGRRKRFAIADHTGQVGGDPVGEVEAFVDRVGAANQGPAVAAGVLGSDQEDPIPLCLGHDITDEDASRASRDPGLGIVARGEEGGLPTEACYSLATIEAIRFLDRLVIGDPDGPQRAAGMDSWA